MKRNNGRALARGLAATIAVGMLACLALGTDAISEAQTMAVAGSAGDMSVQMAEDDPEVKVLVGNAKAIEAVNEAVGSKEQTEDTAAVKATAAPAPTEDPMEAVQAERAAQWTDRAAVKTEDTAYVFPESSEDSSAVATMVKGCSGEVVEKGDTWTKISSGDVEGYVKNECLAYGSEALAVAEDTNGYSAKADADQVSIRTNPEMEADIIQTVSSGETFKVVEEQSDYVKVVSADNKEGYMSKDVVQVYLNVTSATPIVREDTAAETETPEPEEPEETEEVWEEEPEEPEETYTESRTETPAPSDEAYDEEEEEDPYEEPEEEDSASEEVSSSGGSHSAIFKITAYCPCAKCNGGATHGLTAMGTSLTVGRTIAVDPGVIPLGTTVYFNGQAYVAEDTGVSGHTIDLLVSSHAAAYAWGVKYMTVTW